ncbi:MAG: HIT family protein [bacterium]
MSCIFCKILKNEIKSNKVFENDNFIAILDAFPANEGHILIIPKEHYSNIFEIPLDIMQEAYAITHKLASRLKTNMNIQDINILQNNGIIAGQTVNHFHIHLIPRYENDTVVFKSEPVEISEERIQEIIESLEV